MKIKNILIGFLATVAICAVVIGLVFGGTVIFKSINEQQKIKNTFPSGSPVVLKNLDIKGNVREYTGDGRVNILVIDKTGESHTITTDMNLLTKP